MWLTDNISSMRTKTAARNKGITSPIIHPSMQATNGTPLRHWHDVRIHLRPLPLPEAIELFLFVGCKAIVVLAGEGYVVFWRKLKDLGRLQEKLDVQRQAT